MKATRFLLFGLILLGSVNHADAQKQLRHLDANGRFPAGEIQYSNNVKAGHYVQSGDVKDYYEKYGKGEPFVVLHGGAYGSIYEIVPFIDSLSEKYQVIAVSTKRGHGDLK